MFFKNVITRWFKQRRLKKLERELTEARSSLDWYEDVSRSGADSYLTWRSWPAITSYRKEVDRLEVEIQLLRLSII